MSATDTTVAFPFPDVLLAAAEHGLYDVLEHLPDAFFSVDPDWCVTYANRPAMALTGHAREDLFGRVLWDACPELRGTPLEHALREVAAQAGPRRLELRTGKGRWHEVYVWSSGARATSACARDISERKRAQKEVAAQLSRERAGRQEAEGLAQRHLHELMVAREQLMHTEKLAMAGQLASGVGHEINNPLSYVAGNLQFALEHLTPLSRHPGVGPMLKGALGEALEALREARDGAERIRVIVRDLQTFARSDERTLEPVDVHAALEFGVTLAMTHLRSRAPVERCFGPVPRVLAHEARLGQVFLHLLINAAQAIPTGAFEHHRVTLTTRREGPWVLVEVSDTGLGMTPEVLRRAFEPFFTTRHMGEGTGLGLSTCLGLVRGMNGELTATSSPGLGSTFQVRLPVAEAPGHPRPPR